MQGKYLSILYLHSKENYFDKSGRRQQKVKYFCRCVCGNEGIFDRRSIKDSSCGCQRVKSNQSRLKDISGIKFNRLTPLEYLYSESTWLCQCDCGEIVKVQSDRLKNGNTKSCGCLQKEKASKSMRKLLKEYRESVGKDSSKPISDENSIQRDEFHFSMRSKIFIRDNYTCQMCGGFGGKLNVHHILRWSDFPELRFDPYNLVTLCKDCHLVCHNGNTRAGLNTLLVGFLAGIAEEREILAAREPISAKG